MRTIVDVLNLRELTDDRTEMLELIEDEFVRLRNAGDFLGAGEWLAGKFAYLNESQVEEVFTEVITLWASPLEFKTVPSSINDLISRVDEFVPDDLAIAFTSVCLRVMDSGHLLPGTVGDLAFRLSKPISEIFGITARRPMDMCVAAARKLETVSTGFLSAVDSFMNTNCMTAKIASIEVVKTAHELKNVGLPAERAILGEIDILLGPAFRKYCESCERQDIKGIIKRAPDIRELAQRCSSAGRGNSVFWHLGVAQIGKHILHLVEEGSRRSQVSSTPSLQLTSSVFKLDLSRCKKEMTFSCRLVNKGEGRALNVRMEPALSHRVGLEIVEPRGAFEVGGESEQIITFGLMLHEEQHHLEIPLNWTCDTIDGRQHQDEDKLIIEQQYVQPDWGKLLEDPPYSLNPVKIRAKLFGRDAVLNELLIHASAGTSTFLWGQKRVGKTSVLQVLASELQKRDGFCCLVMRMGELSPLHEGQIAHRIAERLCNSLPLPRPTVPTEEEFGAGLSELIPFVERLLKAFPRTKFVVIIDEFDDLDPAFYTGQRGKLFVKALRSLSEMGLTFFFVGSERMNTIYMRHETDLNKWVNVSLDCIESREDCKSLIAHPAAGTIEYQSECVDFLIDYCGRNPFYMNLLCSQMFKRCFQEQRTYVGESDLNSVRRTLVQALGAANFSHFWEDNPELDEVEKAKQAAENCLTLCCVASLGGGYESIDELLDCQNNLSIGPTERLTVREIRRVGERLINRGVISSERRGGKFEIKLPIFRDWLIEHAELRVLPHWKEFCMKQHPKEEEKKGVGPPFILEGYFPVAEEELLSVSQSLMYCGKQKDAIELRVWLKQFDDDNRIEIAFLLLKRLAEKGYVAEGAKLQALSKVVDAVYDARHQIGRRQWTMIKGRVDNLCICFVDSEMKSGATTARELAARLRPSKRGHADSIIDWMRSHSDKDAIVVIIDDFAGTGSSLLTGLEGLATRVKDDRNLRSFLKEKRLLCYLLYAFPEALEKLKRRHPEIQFMAVHVFGDEVRALDSEAGIFSDDAELRFAREILIQIGRELTPQYPLGFGDMGALVCFHNTVPNNTLPIFWSSGTVNEKPWRPLFARP